jgi:spore coat protein A, manganese oxidase
VPLIRHPSFRRPLQLLLAATLAITGTVRADVVVLDAVKDNTLFGPPSSSNSNGAGDHFFVGRTDDGFLRRGLLAFDIGSAIPPGSTVSGVALTLYMSRTKSNVEAIVLRPALQNWGQGASNAGQEEGKGAPAAAGDATWLHTFYPASNWSTQGGDFGSTVSASAPVNKEGFYTWSSAGMVVDVQVWVDNPGTNFGWFVLGNETANKTSKRFDTREIGDVSKRPRLTITYTPPVPSGACCLPGGLCQTLSSAQCAMLGGSYQGNGTSCFPNPCFVPTGACCLPSGNCLQLSSNDCAAQGGTYQGDGSACAQVGCQVVLEPFVDPLPIPAVAVPIVGTPGGAAEYEIRMQQVQQQMHRDLPPTTVWAYGAGTPGPVIEASSGQPVKVRWINDLRDAQGNLLTSHYLPVDTCLHGPDMHGDAPRTVVHLHGGKVRPEADGYPEATFLPGQSVLYEYPNDQPPATLWFHDHAIGITRLNVYMGLAGLYLLRDQTESALGLPSGSNEVPLVIQDRSFRPDGQLDYPATWDEHFFGDKLLVNGKVWPYFEVKRGKYRLRLVNGCSSRTVTLALSNGAVFHQIGTEAGLLPAPVPQTSITIAPGERADCVVDFAPYTAGTKLRFVNTAPAPFPGTPGVGVVSDVIEFRVQAPLGHTQPLPPVLSVVTPLDPGQAAQTRQFMLRKSNDTCTGSKWLINGLGWQEITEYPKLNSTEIWSFVNDSGVMHPMHVHLVLFQVLDRQPVDIIGDQVIPTGPAVLPPANERGWKDTVQCPPKELTRVIMRFEGFTGRYPYHCHILEHEDHEMMRQFKVILGPDIVPYGCGVNPAGSLVHVSGTPKVGSGLTLGLDNPLGTQSPGSIPVLAIAVAPQPAYPCGLLVPGWGMAGPGAAGELLIALGLQLPPLLVGAPWVGPGQPAAIAIAIPNLSTLIGFTAYVQGVLLDPLATAGVSIGLTEAAEIHIGP